MLTDESTYPVLNVVIKGFQPLTLIDYPGKLAAIVFTPGCNFRCPFCYNAALVRDDAVLPVIPEEIVFRHLEKRRDILGGLVVTGGEPTLQKNLPEFLRKVKSLGYAVKLDSNGSHPEVIRELIDFCLVDYLAVDVKTALGEKYSQLTGAASLDLEKVKESWRLVVLGKIAGELRTTVVPRFHDEKVLLKMAQQLAELGKEESGNLSWTWYLQSFQPKDCFDPRLNEEKPGAKIADSLLYELQGIVPQVVWRG